MNWTWGWASIINTKFLVWASGQRIVPFTELRKMGRKADLREETLSWVFKLPRFEGPAAIGMDFLEGWIEFFGEKDVLEV